MPIIDIKIQSQFPALVAVTFLSSYSSSLTNNVYSKFWGQHILCNYGLGARLSGLLDHV